MMIQGKHFKNRDDLNNVVAELVSPHVAFHWEYEAIDFPVIEVYLHESKDTVTYLVKQIEKRIREKSISESQAEVDMEELEGFYRITIEMDFMIMNEDEIQILVDVLKDYGSSEFPTN